MLELNIIVIIQATVYSFHKICLDFNLNRYYKFYQSKKIRTSSTIFWSRSIHSSRLLTSKAARHGNKTNIKQANMGLELREQFVIEGNIYKINFPLDFSKENTRETPRQINIEPPIMSKLWSIVIILLLYWRVRWIGV